MVEHVICKSIPSLDNARVNRAATDRFVVSGADDKIGVSQSSAERCSDRRNSRLRVQRIVISRLNCPKAETRCLRSSAQKSLNAISLSHVTISESSAFALIPPRDSRHGFVENGLCVVSPAKRSIAISTARIVEHVRRAELSARSTFAKAR